jgi:hypothetical protein
MGVRFWQEEEIFFLLHSVQTDSGSCPFSYEVGIREPFLGVKQSEPEAVNSLSFSSEVRYVWS